MKVAIVCSYLNQNGGAERVLEKLHEIYPTAPVYTSIFDRRVMPRAYRHWDIRTSFLQRLPVLRRYHQLLLPLYPLAFEQFDFSDYDVVISNTSGFAHGIITQPQTCHICYCLTPARFLWNFEAYARDEVAPLVRRALMPLVAVLRLWDAAAALRVDRFVAISNAVAARIAKYYRRPSTVLYPSIDTTRYHPSDGWDDFFLVVSRLIPYKRIELAVQACSELGLPLRVVGDGRYRRTLEAMAGPTVQFLGRVEEAALRELYARCKALVFPGEEDFGLTPLEAQASGRPVVAFAGGGALETVIDGQTGVFFNEPSVEALAAALGHFRADAFDPRYIRCHAERFDAVAFKHRFAELVKESYAEQSGRTLVLRG